MITIALGIVLGVILLAFLPVIAGVIVWLFVISIAAIAVIIIFSNASFFELYIFLACMAVITVGGALLLAIDFAWSFYNLRTFFRFLAVKLFTPGFSDNQKILKAKKIGKIIEYSDNRKKQAEKDKVEKRFLDFQSAFNDLNDLAASELQLYLKRDIINFKISKPSRADLEGSITINTKKNKSIIILSYEENYSVNDDGFHYKIVRDSMVVPPPDQRRPNDENWRYLNSLRFGKPKPAVKKAKKYLLDYIKKYPDEAD